ncbi:MAG: xanthine dehydrogenase family protein molybdopterin-binding subunit [Thermoplasmata archaeon]
MSGTSRRARASRAGPAPWTEATTGWFGRSVPTKESARFVTGSGQYMDDLRLPHTAFLGVLRSPYAHARIRSIDTEKARRAPGVVAVYTGADLRQLVDPFLQLAPPPADKVVDLPLAVDKVRHVGEPVVAIVAEDRYLAADAAELVEVDYEPLPPVIDVAAANAPSAPLLHEQIGTNEVWRGIYEYGDVDAAFGRADTVLHEHFHYHRFNSAPLELNAALADFNPRSGELTLYSNNVMPMFCLPLIALSLRMTTDRIRIVVPDTGGSFGNKINSFPFMILVSAISKELGRPIQWIELRSEFFAAGTHGNERTFDVDIAARKDGTLLALKVTAWDDCGAFARYEPAGAVIWAQVAFSMYRHRALRVDYHELFTNKCPVGPNRGYSRAPHLFLYERVMDRIADHFGLDRVAVRERNFVRPSEMPYPAPNGTVLDGGDYPRALGEVVRRLDLPAFRRRQEALRKQGRYLGIGIAGALDSSGNNFAQVRVINPHLPFSGNSEAARVWMDPMGGLHVAIGPTNQGQGHETISSQIVAHELGVDPGAVHALPNFDSNSHPSTGTSGAYASRTAVMAGGAIFGAVRELKGRLARIGAHLLETSVEDIEFGGGEVRARSSGRSLPLYQLGATAGSNVLALPPEVSTNLSVTYVYRPPFAIPNPVDKQGNFTLTYSYQLHGAIVEVDPETGKVRIDRYVAVDDCGNMINPAIVEGQVIGAAVHGIEASLLGNLQYSPEGQLLATSFVDFLAATARDVPEIEVGHLVTPSTTGPEGMRGVGEGGGTALSVLASAIEDALAPFGARFDDSHFTPEGILDGIRSAPPGVVRPAPPPPPAGRSRGAKGDRKRPATAAHRPPGRSSR